MVHVKKIGLEENVWVLVQFSLGNRNDEGHGWTVDIGNGAEALFFEYSKLTVFWFDAGQ